MPSESKIRGRSAKGALYVPMHAERRVTIYPVEDSEMESLADINSNVAFWSAIAGIGAGLVLGCTWDIISSGGYEKATFEKWDFLFAVFAVLQFSSVIASKNKTGGSGGLKKFRSKCKRV